MALINCPECGKEISDKAASCPNCGCPNQSQNKPIVADQVSLPKNDDIMKCPKCNSTQLTSNKKGFSGGQAVAGAVLTGGIGLLAGTIGSGSVVVTCLKCGHKFKAGDYASEKRKFEKEREMNKRMAKGQESYIGIIILFLVLSVIGGIISHKLFINDWNFLGFIFNVATLACVFMTGFCIYTESTRKPR